MEIAALAMFLIVLILLMSGYPVSLTLGGVATLFGLFFLGIDFFLLLPSRLMGVLSNYILVAVPLFIMMGVTLEKSGMANGLLEQMSLVLGGKAGGLAISTILVGALLAASTGIVGATVITMGLISLPIMMNQGYDDRISTGVIMASGTMGQIVPPSIILVLLGSILNVSVGTLFRAAIMPSILLFAGYIIYLTLLASFRPDLMPAHEPSSRRIDWSILLKSLMPPLLLVVIVLGSILAGIASPTEAAGIGAFGSIILAGFHRKWNWSIGRSILYETAHITTMVFFILLGATTLALVFRGMEGDKLLLELFAQHIHSARTLIFITMVAFFILGFFIDFIELIFIFIPVLTPIFSYYDVDLVWLAILVAINLQTSFLTPPFGFALFYLRGVTPSSISTGSMYSGVVPYLIIQLTVLVIIYLWPQLLM